MEDRMVVVRKQPMCETTMTDLRCARSRSAPSLLVLGLSLVLAAACGDSSAPGKLDWPKLGPPLPFPDYCQPLLAEVEPEKTQPLAMCLLPYSSDVLEEQLQPKIVKSQTGSPIRV